MIIISLNLLKGLNFNSPFLGSAISLLKRADIYAVNYIVTHKGYCIAYLQCGVSESNILLINWFGIDAKYQGQGHGFRILKRFLATYIVTLYNKVITTLDIENERAIYVFEKLGFVKSHPEDGLIDMEREV
jgi:RimJ/RimL family protein N-acetyltransferase